MVHRTFDRILNDDFRVEKTTPSLETAIAALRENMAWRLSLYFEARAVVDEQERLQGNSAIIDGIQKTDSKDSPTVVAKLAHAFQRNVDPKDVAPAGESSTGDRQWAEDMRRRDAECATLLSSRQKRLRANETRFKDAHSVVMQYALGGKLPESDVGALAVLAITGPVTEDDAYVVSRHYDQALAALRKLEVLTPPFEDLLMWARAELKGKQLVVVELMCESGGRLPLADLAADVRIRWRRPWDSAYNCIRTKVNAKLELHNKGNRLHGRPCLQYDLKRAGNCAVIECLVAPI
jgi:hypothetical protein